MKQLLFVLLVALCLFVAGLLEWPQAKIDALVAEAQATRAWAEHAPTAIALSDARAAAQIGVLRAQATAVASESRVNTGKGNLYDGAANLLNGLAAWVWFLLAMLVAIVGLVMFTRLVKRMGRAEGASAAPPIGFDY